MKRGKWIVIFCLWGFVALLVSFYLRFPRDLCRNVLVANSSKWSDYAHVSVGDCRPVFPLGINIKQIIVHFFQPSGEMVVKDITLKPRLSFIRLKWAFTGSASILDGKVHGFMSVKEKPEGEINFRRLNLDQPLPKAILGREIRGKMDGRVIFKGDGSAQLAVKITQGFYQLYLPGWSGVEINNLEGRMRYDKGTLVLEQVDLTSPGFKGKLNGKVIFDWQEMKNTRLNLTWEMESPQTGKSVSTIQGTVGNALITPVATAPK